KGNASTKIDHGRAQIVYSDDKGEIRIETIDGKKVLTAKDPKGLLLFSGPIETPEEIQKMPPEVRQRFEQLQHNDLPSAFASQPGAMADDEENDQDADDADSDSDDDEGDSAATEQVSVSPQMFPR